MKKKLLCIALVALLMLGLCGCDELIEALKDKSTRPVTDTGGSLPFYTLPATVETVEVVGTAPPRQEYEEDEWRYLGLIPEFTDKPYHVINDNKPFFTKEDMTTRSYESYPELDELGRCVAVMSCIGTDLMPTEDRGEIGQIKPTGWHTVKYDCVNGKYLYNRCHLIGFQLTGENANERNLITGTRYMNVDGMLPFENMVADYLKEERDNHVLYRVTPVFLGDNLVAHGVVMEAYSVEDDGEGICFNVFCYNAQPEITIDYKTGESWLTAEAPAPTEKETKPTETPMPTGQTAVKPEGSVDAAVTAGNDTSASRYIINEGTKRFHKPDCPSAEDIKQENKREFFGQRQELTDAGYRPCGSCKP
ncbi:MAG: DNA/RNA non-specific endonuclease [Clostridia bacterium]|nr:DNA/RNA non-specific endonuclease [Clostridia bacterium]